MSFETYFDLHYKISSFSLSLCGRTKLSSFFISLKTCTKFNLTYRFDHIAHISFLRDKVSAAFKNSKNILLFWKILLFQNDKRYKELAAVDEYRLWISAGEISLWQSSQIRRYLRKLGMTYTFEVGIYFWLVPPLVTVIMFVIFKRNKLLRVTQKFIISIMVINLCYITTSFVRDTILKVFDMHYGFLDYDVCSDVIILLRIQLIFHTSSLWMSTLMTLHHLLLVGFSLKVKLCNLSAYFTAFIAAHILLSVSFLLILTFPSFEPVSFIQE